MYIDFFNLPDTFSRIYWNTRINGMGIAVGTGILSVLLGVRGILRVTPAQAMRAKTPSVGTLITLPSFLARRLKTMEKMGFRSVVRNPFRGFLIILAVAFPFSMSSVLLSFKGVANQMYFDQFDKVQTYDIQISTDRYISELKARSAIEAIRGVAKSETAVNMAVELKHENLSEFAMVYGLNPGSDMWRIMDLYGSFYEPPDDGIILNTRVAEKLHLKAGDIAKIRVSRLTPEPIAVPVKAVISESLGSGCYMSKEGFYRFFSSVPFTDTILLTVEDGKRSEVRDQLMKTSRVAWLVDTSRIVKSYRDMMGSMLAMTGMFALMAVIAGGILIYNISMINVRERITEFGTLIIMGATDREIGRILFFEQGIYFIAGVLIGLPGSAGIKILLERVVISDSYTIDLTIDPLSYFKAFLTCGAMAGISLLAQTRYVKKIRLTDILKERE
jgi:putative ABC transport system permease protein